MMKCFLLIFIVMHSFLLFGCDDPKEQKINYLQSRLTTTQSANNKLMNKMNLLSRENSILKTKLEAISKEYNIPIELNTNTKKKNGKTKKTIYDRVYN